MISRKERLKKIKVNNEVSVLIIGAGINGIGTFRDLAFQGVDVLMVDRGDYCSGASAASSQMVHGGIRYLENGEFRLVREAVQERNRLIENAPHLVTPLPTTIPIFKYFSGLLNAPLKFLGLMERPAERGAVVIKIGMMYYDFLTRKQKTVPKHEFMNRKDSLDAFPQMNPDIICTATYYDGMMPMPERIAIELILDAVKENEDAIPLNYVSFVSGEAGSVILRDELSGETFSVRPKIVVNAAGPWIDLVNHSASRETEYIRGTKGSHIVLDHPELRAEIGQNEIFFENKDGRIVLILPLKDKVLIGSSDIDIGDPDKAVISDEEVDYFFEMVKVVFPEIELDISQIVYTFSGVRPLVYSKSKSSGQISRDHRILVDESGGGIDFPVFSLVGGKWTTFRAFAEQTANKVLERLGRTRLTGTEDMKIGGGQKLPKDQDMLSEYPHMSRGEVRYMIENEDVIHLDDLIFRRNMIGKLGMLTEEGLSELAEICAEEKDWDQVQMKSEIKRVILIMAEKNRMKFKKFIGNSSKKRNE